MQAVFINVSSDDSDDTTSEMSEFDIDHLLEHGVELHANQADVKEDILEGLTACGETVSSWNKLTKNHSMTKCNHSATNRNDTACTIPSWIMHFINVILHNNNIHGNLYVIII